MRCEVKMEIRFGWQHTPDDLMVHWKLGFTSWAFRSSSPKRMFGYVMPPGINHLSKWYALFYVDETSEFFDTAEEAKEWIIDRLCEWCEKEEPFITLTVESKERIEKAIEIARNLKQTGVPVATIAKATGLTPDEVERL